MRKVTAVYKEYPLLGEFDYHVVGKNFCTSILYHPSGEGDLDHYCHVFFDDGKVQTSKRIFRPDTVDFEG